MGLVRPAAGSIRFAGHDIAGWEPHRIARAGLGWVPEDQRVFADLTVIESLEAGRQPPNPGRRSGCSPSSPTSAGCGTGSARA